MDQVLSPTIGVHLTNDHAVMIRPISDTSFAIIPDERGQRVIALEPASSRREHLVRLGELARATCDLDEDETIEAVFTLRDPWSDEEREALRDDSSSSGWNPSILLSDSAALVMASTEGCLKAPVESWFLVTCTRDDTQLTLTLVEVWDDVVGVIAHRSCAQNPESIVDAWVALLDDARAQDTMVFNDHVDSWRHGGKPLAASQHEALEQCLGMTRRLDVHPIEGFALGAAWCARSNEGVMMSVGGLPVTEQSLGVTTGDSEPDWLIPRWSVLPRRITERYAVTRDAPCTVVRIVCEEFHEETMSVRTLGVLELADWFDDEGWCEVAVTLDVVDPERVEVICVHDATGSTRRSTYDLTQNPLRDA